jgi:hypothetical protein
VVWKYYCNTIPIICSRVLSSSPGRLDLSGLGFKSPVPARQPCSMWRGAGVVELLSYDFLQRCERIKMRQVFGEFRLKSNASTWKQRAPVPGRMGKHQTGIM